MKKYNLIKNATYAIEGIFYLFKEKSFLLELIFIIPLLIISFFLDLTTIQKSIMGASLIFILIMEAVNTAIENVVDLVTNEWAELAKKAKDIASGAVLLTVLQAIFIWIVNLI